MFVEKPPMTSGNNTQDVAAIRDYLFRLARTLEPISEGPGVVEVVGYNAQGQPISSPASGTGNSKDNIEAVRKNAEELKALIIKSANELQGDIETGDNGVISYVDGKADVYNSLYVAKSEYGQFTESITAQIENTARGVVESYEYGAAIQSMQDNIDLVQNYLTSVNGEIRRGIVLDPDTNQYVTGIAISQALVFEGECGPSDSHNPGDGYTYYYLSSGQTFGLYTSTGWQFWIDGYKKGWYSSTDGMLHIKNVYVEDTLNISGKFQFDVSYRYPFDVLEIKHIGE